MKKLRLTGDKTRQHILKAAKALFVKQGFAATSISQIAQRADINQSLIYHHFEDKKSLWQLVKETSLQDYLQELNTLFQNTQLSGTEFIRTLIRRRVDLLLKKPDIQKMLYWQLIESNASLRHTPNYNPDLWLHAIERLQAKKQFRQDLDPAVILALISVHMSGLSLYIDGQRPTPEHLNTCRLMVEEACIAAVVL